MIENGKVIYLVKGVILIGNGLEVMLKVFMFGYDFVLDKGVGICGKEGQLVLVGVGQLMFKVDELVVGGI